MRRMCAIFARAWDVPLKPMRIDAAALWRSSGESVAKKPDAGHAMKIFEECLQEMGGCRGAIAVAHHRDDCAERFCFTCSAALVWTEWRGFARCEKTERESMIIRPLFWKLEKAVAQEMKAFSRKKGFPGG